MAKQQGNEDSMRLIFAYLPGRMNTVRVLEKELEELKRRISSGQREYMALLPGMELDLRNLKQEVQGMANSLPGYTETEDPEPKQISAHGEVNWSDISPRLVWSYKNRGKLTLPARVLVELQHAPDNIASIDYLQKKLGKDFSLNEAIVRSAFRKLNDAGIEISLVEHGSGKYRLITKVTGEPEAEPEPEPEAPHNGDGNMPEHLKGTAVGLLVNELRAHPQGVHFKRLAKKHGKKSPYAFNWTMATLRDLGWEFEQVGVSVFRLVKEGRFPNKTGGNTRNQRRAS